MVTVYLIDKDGGIESAVGDRLGYDASENEVHALNAIETGKPDVVLLHYAVRGKNTAEYIALLRNANVETEIVVIGNDLHDEQIIDCVLAGAKGYQNLSNLEQYLEKLIQAVAEGEAWISRKMVSRLINYWRNH